MKKLFTFLALAFSVVLIAQTGASAATINTINYNDVISDSTFDNANSMSAAQINTFLNSFPSSCLSTKNGYSFAEPTGYSSATSFTYGSNVSAGTVFHDAAQAYGINPQVLLTTTEKEEGLVRGDGPYGCSALAFSAAMGYACTDSGTASHTYSGIQMYVKNGKAVNSVSDTCVNSNKYVGFSRQVINATWLLTFDRHRSEGLNNWYAPAKTGWDNSDDLNFCYRGYMEDTNGRKVYQCPDDTSHPSDPFVAWSGQYAIDGTKVTIQNGATAALYHYTPHLHGQSLFFSTFSAWFGPPTIKDDFKFEQLSGTSPAKLRTSSSSLGTYTKTVTVGQDIYTFYYDATNHCLRFAQWNGSRWSNHVLDGPAASGYGVTSDDVGQGITATVYHGELQVYYYDATSGNLRHAWIAGDGAWHTQTLDGSASSLGGHNADVGQDPTFLIYHDELQIYYYNATSGNLMHAWWPGGHWHFQTMDGATSSLGGHNADVGQDTAAIIWNGQLQLYYYNATSGNLMHAWWPGGHWHFQTMDGASGSLGKFNADVGKDVAVTIYSNNQLQLYYYDATDGNLRHAWWPGGHWHFQTMDGASGSLLGNNENVGSKVVVAPFQNDLYIFYYDTTESSWRAAYWDGSWNGFNLDGGTDPVSTSTAAVSGELSAAISQGKSLQIFYQGSDGNLFHAWANR